MSQVGQQDKGFLGQHPLATPMSQFQANYVATEAAVDAPDDPMPFVWRDVQKLFCRQDSRYQCFEAGIVARVEQRESLTKSKSVDNVCR